MVSIAALIAAAVFSDGFDVKKVNLQDNNIWILQKNNPNPNQETKASGRYAKVNTNLNEIGLTTDVDKPSALFQTAAGSVLFNQEAFVNISTAQPANFLANSEDAITLTASPLVIDSNPSYVALVDQSRVLRVSTFDGSKYPTPREVQLPKDAAKGFGFDSVTLGNDGSAYAYSSNDNKVRQYDLIKEEWTSRADSLNGIDSTTIQMAVVAGKWALLDTAGGKLWLEGDSNSISVQPNSFLQQSSEAQATVYLASLAGITKVSKREVTSVSVAGALETARPVEFGGIVYGAFLGSDQGWMFSSATNEMKELDYNKKILDAKRLQSPEHDLVLSANGESAVINETYSGWAWSLPNGTLVQGSQDWDGDPGKRGDCADSPESCKTKQEPPRPVDDTFGVRAGQLISLPVLINDSDTNAGDIITIVPESIKGLDPNFGEVRVSSNQQMLTVAVKSSARGFGRFKYQISDGISKISESATVTLTVKPNNKNSAPGWCTQVVSTCIQEKPRVSLAPGTEITIPFLNAWVDPEGDRFFISEATITNGEGNLAFSGSGELVYQNQSTGSKKGSTVDVRVVVSDVKGADRIETLQINVNPDMSAALDVPVLVGTSGEPLSVDFSDYVNGALGSISIQSLVPAKSNRNDGINIVQEDATKFKLTSQTAESTILDLTASLSETKKVTQTIRVNFVSPDVATLATSPVTVLVSPGLDTSLDLFKAAHNPGNRALVVSSISTSSQEGASLTADKIKGGFIRIRGNTANDTAGFIGVVNYKISDGSGTDTYTATGQAFVYEMPDPIAKAPVARRDSVIVRAGDVAEVDVLANDLGEPGVPLTIDSKSFIQKSKTNCIEGGLVFAAGGKVRVVAPKTQGLYTCNYSIYPANNPSVKAVATLQIRVRANDESNQVPVANNLYARVRAGETVNIPVPAAGVDADGDTVSVKALGGVKGVKGAAYVSPDGASLQYSAVAGASGQDSFTYTLVDSKAGVSLPAVVKIAIIDTDPDTAPVTMNDYAEVRVGATNKVVLDPVSNDFDPQPDSKNPISLIPDSVKPKLPPTSKNYELWAKHLHVDKTSNKITIDSDSEPVTMRFVYTAKSSSGSQAFGYITVRVVGDAVQDAPDITDTYVSQNDQANKLSQKGIDVISNKVIWTSGDTAKLTLSVWGGLDGFKVINNSYITSANIPKQAGLVIFKLSGTNFYGKEVESYGFMHLPGTQPKITFDPAKALVSVKENASKTFDLTDPNFIDQANLTIGKVKAHGLREAANCKVTSGTTIEYTAGAGAPWRDFCDVQVKIAGSNDDFTNILVPIKIIPLDPDPVLTPRKYDYLPGGDPLQVDLESMTTWEGKNEADKKGLNYSTSGGEDLFNVEQKNHILTITLKGNAPKDSVRKIQVSVDSKYQTEPVDIEITVKELDVARPAGPDITKECSVNDNFADCMVSQAEINSGPGYQNEANKGDLRFAPFGYTSGVVNYGTGSSPQCGSVTLKASATSIESKWNKTPGNMAPGSRCVITYQVLDGLDRLGKGTLTINFKGVPGAVRSATQVDYSADSITLLVNPPENSFPEIEAFVIKDEGNGKTFECDFNPEDSVHKCLIEGLKAFEKHKYSIRAKNSEGVSNKQFVLDEAYAYRAPKQLKSNNIRFTTVYNPAATSPATGYAKVTIYPVADASIKSYTVWSDVQNSSQQKSITDLSTPLVFENVQAKPGTKSTIRVSAVGSVKPPVGTVTDNSTAASATGVISSIPRMGSVSASIEPDGNGWSAKVEVADVDANYSEKNVNMAFVLYSGSTAPTCSVTADGSDVVIGGSAAATALVSKEIKAPNSGGGTKTYTSKSFSLSSDNSSYTPLVCFANGFGRAAGTGATVSTLSDPKAREFTYVVNSDPVNGAWLVDLSHSVTSPGVVPEFNGSDSDAESAWKTTIYSTSFGKDPVIRVRYCTTSSPKACSSGERRVTASDSSRSWQMKITGLAKLLNPSNDTRFATKPCAAGMILDFDLNGSGLQSAGGTRLWQLASDSEVINPSGSFLFETVTNGWQLPEITRVSSLKLRFQGRDSNSTRHVQGLTGVYEVTYRCQ
ncbi:MAG: hypothetical protein RIS26_531 [Actinomycetota bacterium]